MQIFLTIGDIFGIVLFMVVACAYSVMAIWRLMRPKHTNRVIDAGAAKQRRRNIIQLYGSVDPSGELMIDTGTISESAKRHMTAH